MHAWVGAVPRFSPRYRQEFVRDKLTQDVPLIATSKKVVATRAFRRRRDRACGFVKTLVILIHAVLLYASTAGHKSDLAADQLSNLQQHTALCRQKWKPLIIATPLPVPRTRQSRPTCRVQRYFQRQVDTTSTITITALHSIMYARQHARMTRAKLFAGVVV